MSSDKTAAAIAAIMDSRPPTTDKFTYLTILESHLSPEVLPTLNDILQDAELTQDIGWDLVFNLVGLPGSEICLETIARLGNPREVILKVLEALERMRDGDESQGDSYGIPVENKPSENQGVPVTDKFITLLGMLDILHKRIQTKHPSRFLLQTLQTIYRAYEPNQEMTAAVINIVHSLSGQRRPPLPTRKSSFEVSNLALASDPSRSAPDPEAEKADQEYPAEVELQHRLLLSFATCILEAYVNGNDMGWAGRLLEFYQPKRVVPGRKTLTESFREDQELLERDAIVGKLVALTRDLGLSECSNGFLSQLSKPAQNANPLSEAEGVSNPGVISLSTGGCISLVAYWVFSATMFEADQPQPSTHLFPDLLNLLRGLMADDPEAQVLGAPGTAQSIITVGLWLQSTARTSANLAVSLTNTSKVPEEPSSEFMALVHLLTLVALYHPTQHVRNTAGVLAGCVFHADPVDEDRLRILYDLLENCEFAQLKALAITWLREEIITASNSNQTSAFTTPQALETVQYALFPNVAAFIGVGEAETLDYLTENMPCLLQAVNLGLFLWTSSKWKYVLPANMDSAVAERWFRPLQDAAQAMIEASTSGGELSDRIPPALAFEIDVLHERLKMLSEAEAFMA